MCCSSTLLPNHLTEASCPGGVICEAYLHSEIDNLLNLGAGSARPIGAPHIEEILPHFPGADFLVPHLPVLISHAVRFRVQSRGPWLIRGQNVDRKR